MDLLVLAKEPRPGAVKTRLCPPCTPIEAAAIAAASLQDTLEAACASHADRVVLGLDGSVGDWCPPGVVIVDQGSGDLGTRLETLWSHAAGPALQIGMDTPQATASVLDEAMSVIERPEVDAVLGLAADGGWWALGRTRPTAGACQGIPTSRSDTGARQLARLEQLGLRTEALEVLRDVDQWDDALAVAGAGTARHFTAAVRSVNDRLAAG